MIRTFLERSACGFIGMDMTRLLTIPLSPVASLGARVRRLFSYLAVLSVFIYLPLWRTLMPPYWGISSIRKTTVMQIYFTGVQALSLFVFLGLVMGLSLSMVLATATGIKATICSHIIKEVVPLVVAFVILGRSGTAITVELGNMTVLGEIKQLRRMGIDPYRHVIFPRLMGVTCAIFFMGLFFGLTITVTTALLSTEPFFDFFQALLNDWSLMDLLIIAEKQTLFGLIISMVACYQGLSLIPATTEVPKATIRTVIHCITLCVIVDFLFKFTLLGG